MIKWDAADFSHLKESAAKHGYSQFIAAFDIETTTIYDEETPYFAFMYVWQFAVGDIAVYGRTWDEFVQFLRNLRDDLNLKIDKRLIVFVHNLKYEFSFMKKINGLYFAEENFLAKDKNDVIRCVVNDVFEFRDSVIYTEKPLSELGKIVNIPKPEYDYNKIRTNITPLTADELEYCSHDVLILTKFFETEVKKRGYGYIGRIPLTATRIVKRIIQKNLNAMYARGVMYSKQPKNDDDLDVLQTLENAYFGSFNYCTTCYRTEIVPNVYRADISSFYPAIALFCKFPLKKFAKMSNFPDSIEGLLKLKQPILVKITLTNLHAKYPRFSYLPAQHDNWVISGIQTLNKRIVHADRITLTVNEIDLQGVQDYYTYDDENIVEVYTAKTYAPLPKYIIQSIVDLYREKKRSKEKYLQISAKREPTPQEEDDYKISKAMLNRIYGIFVQKPVLMQYGFDNKLGKVVELGEGYVKSDDDCGVLYQWGVWLTSYARQIITKNFAAIALETAKNGKRKNNDVVLYSDTDSLHYTASKIANTIISQHNEKCKQNLKKLRWRYSSICNCDELEGIGEFEVQKYEKFKACDIKKYCYTFIDDNGDERFKAVVSGLSRENEYFSRFKTIEEKMDALTEDMEIPPELAKNKSNKYIDTEITETVVDYCGQPCEVTSSSCCVLGLNGFNFTNAEYGGKSPEQFHRVLISKLENQDIKVVAKRRKKRGNHGKKE